MGEDAQADDAPASGKQAYTRFVDVCLIVRSLFQSVEDIGITPSPPVQLKATLLGVVSRQIVPGRVFPINLHAKSIPGRVWGMLFRYADHADILYRRELNLCWTRFVICKEISHLLIDTQPRHFTTDPIALAQRLIADLPQSLEEDVQSEHAAGYAALELLLPWCLRPKFNEMVGDGLTDLEIAEHFKCPAIYVSMMRGKYGEMSHAANQFECLQFPKNEQ